MATPRTIGHVYMHNQRRRCGFSVAMAVLVILLANWTVRAQQTSRGPMSLGQAVQRALETYPAIAVSQEQVNAAAAGIDLARTAYLPRVDSVAQINRATRNNILG